jgi:hypothetical protein
VYVGVPTAITVVAVINNSVAVNKNPAGVIQVGAVIGVNGYTIFTQNASMQHSVFHLI